MHRDTARRLVELGASPVRIGHHFLAAGAGADAVPHLLRAAETESAVGAYRDAFTKPKAVIGEQDERIHTARVWVLPNPSGLNANYQLSELVRLFAELREAAH